MQARMEDTPRRFCSILNLSSNDHAVIPPHTPYARLVDAHLVTEHRHPDLVPLEVPQTPTKQPVVDFDCGNSITQDVTGKQ